MKKNKKCQQRAKQIASKFESDDQMQNRTIKQIIERAKNKNPKKIFPWEFYDGTLKWELDKKLSQKFEEERETEEKMNGILIVNKPKQYTSHDVVAKSQKNM